MTYLDRDDRRLLERIRDQNDLILQKLGVVIHEENEMSEAAEALTAEITQLGTDVAADNAAIVTAGEAVAAAGTEFTSLKTEIEGLQAGVPLTEEQITALTAKATEADTQLTTGTAALTEHVQALGAETAGA
jgi:chromosome segregation ATPase